MTAKEYEKIIIELLLTIDDVRILNKIYIFVKAWSRK